MDQKLIIFAFLSYLVVVRGQLGIECPFPEGSSVESQTECARYSACAWTGAVCRMQDNAIAGYAATSAAVDTGRGFQVNLEKIDASASMFNQDIQQLVFEVINHEDYHVQAKIYDPSNSRYEVPLTLNLPSAAGTPALYTVNHGAVGDPFSFSVIRNSNGNTIFNTVGPITFEDQFIQFTIALSSPFVYGFGENAHTSFKHNFASRITTPLFARDQPVGNDEYNQYGVHPYYVNIEDDEGNTHSVLLYSSNAMEYSTFTLDDGTPAVTWRVIGGIIDLHFFLGPQPEEVNQQYANLIGNPTVPPYWALGFHLSRYGYNTLDNLRAIRQRNKDAGIPQDVQVCDIDYMLRARDFTYNEVDWNGFPEFIDELHADGVKLTLILDPAIAIDFTNYPPSSNGVDSDAFVKWMDSSLVPTDQEPGTDEYMIGYVWPDTKTLFPDFMKSETRDWWTRECQTLHDTLEFDALWIDMNEPSNFGTNMNRPFNYPPELPDWSLKCPFNAYDSPPFPTKATYQGVNDCQRISDKTICMSGLHSDGISSYLHYDVHSLYGIYECRATQQALEAIFPGKRQLILSRSTYPGSGKYAAHWLGDNTANWEQLRKSIVGMLEFSLFGIPNTGADICGFFEPSTEELCSRWMQLGAFYPFSRNHNTLGMPDQDPARPDWPTLTSVSREVLLLKYKYLPYLYTLFHKASESGSTVVRPIFANFPADIGGRNINDQFFWGDGLMIAPIVYEGTTSRSVYFPQGLYYDLVEGTLAATGPQSLTVDAPIEKIPVYARGGTILPFQEPAVTTTLSRQNPLGLTIALDESGSATGDLFWDDGETISTMADSYMASFGFSNNQLTSSIMHGETVVAGLNFETIQFYGYPSNPSSIDVNGVIQDSSTWAYDAATEVLTLFTSLPLAQELTITLT